jgi:7 transmembrane receptor (rhodopsin family)
MAAVAIDRFGSITRWSRWYLTYRQVLVWICILWLFSLVLMMPPLFGWSRFILEGIQTSCTFDFFTRSTWSISYVLYLTVLGYILPVIVILVCYCLIVRHLVRHRSIMFNSGFAIYADAIAPRARTRTNSSLAGTLLDLFKDHTSCLPILDISDK